MLSRTDIQHILAACQREAEIGLASGCHATLDELEVDFVKSPTDFLGVGSNPAIFVTAETHALLGRFHSSWRINQTIAVKEDFLAKPAMRVIGILVHETGHAFNLAAGVANTEANAYLFEIEILARWANRQDLMLFGCTREDVQSFLCSRLTQYRAETVRSEHLAELVEQIESDLLLVKEPAPKLSFSREKLYALRALLFLGGDDKCLAIEAEPSKKLVRARSVACLSD